MENGPLFTFPQSQTPIFSGSCSSIFVPHLQCLQLKSTSHFHFITSHNHYLSLSFTLTPKFSKWHSNANRNFSFSFDEENEEEEEEEEKDEEEPEIFSGNVKKMKKKRKWWSNKKPPKMNKKRPAIVFDEAIESILIFKVFKSFGWFLPVIIISFLLCSGLKAFLMTSALYLALSVLFLAFEKLWGMMQHKPIHKARMRSKASSLYASSVQIEEEGVEVQDTGRAKMDNPSWVGSDNGSVNKGTQDVPDFGGWDFLDEARPLRGTSRVTSELPRTKEEKLSGNERRVTSKSQRTKEEMLNGNGRRVTSKSHRTKDEKLSGKGRGIDTPLLLRLLIAVFPFIGFWAKMFW